MKPVRTASALGATLATAGLVTLATGAAITVTSTSAQAAKGGTDNIYVCKWSKTPDGEVEKIKPGQNPIVTSVSAIDGFTGTFPSTFSDAQNFSVAIGYAGGDNPVLDVDDCLANPPVVDPTPTVTVTEPTETVTVTEPTETVSEPTEIVTVTEPTETISEPTETVTVTEPTETVTTGGTAGPRPPGSGDPTPTDIGDPEPTVITDPAPTTGNPKVTTDDPTPNEVPTGVAAGLGAPAAPVTDESSSMGVALSGAGGLMAFAGGLLLVGTRRRGDQKG